MNRPLTRVELLGCYVKRTNWTKRVEQALTSPRRVVDLSTLRSVVRKLRPEQVAELVAAYKSGASTYELAEQFKIHRTTVSAHLRRQGVEMRFQGLTEGQVVQAARLYQAGWSCARLGGHFGVDGETVRHSLWAIGVVMRGPHERT